MIVKIIITKSSSYVFCILHIFVSRYSTILHSVSDLLGYKSRNLVNTSWYLYSHMCDTKVIKECHEIGMNLLLFNQYEPLFNQKTETVLK